MNPLGTIYGAAARARRRWYAGRPAARRRLARPVISVGNLAVGGSGKTPAVEQVARLLLAEGERPAILSRGYGRRVAASEPTVVSDGQRLMADLDRAGDEPLMLARALPGAAVVVAPARYDAGTLAETRLGCTVHLLDDGFQHLQLERDVNLLLMATGDLEDRMLPAGRLREPLSAASAADAVIVTGADASRAEAVARQLGVTPVFRTVVRIGAPRMVQPYGEPAAIAPGTPVFGLAGIARPERFFAAALGAGWRITGEQRMRDHHRYTRRDVERIVAAARRAGAAAVLTTAKDAVRLEAFAPFPLPFCWLPMEVAIEPAQAFREWLLARLAAARAGRAEAAPGDGRP